MSKKTIKAKGAITAWNETPVHEASGDAKISRVAVTMSLEGDLEGETKAEFVMTYRDDGSASFVGMERFEGSMDGEQGSFVLQTIGVYETGEARSEYRIVEGSGRGGFAGMTGTGTMRAKHGEAAEIELSISN